MEICLTVVSNMELLWFFDKIEIKAPWNPVEADVDTQGVLLLVTLESDQLYTHKARHPYTCSPLLSVRQVHHSRPII